MEPKRLETMLARAGGNDPATGGLVPPLQLSTTFEHAPAGELIHGFFYNRYGNPTVERCEIALAQKSKAVTGAAEYDTEPNFPHRLDCCGGRLLSSLVQQPWFARLRLPGESLRI